MSDTRYTEPNKPDGELMGYRFGDLETGLALQRVIMTPEFSAVTLAVLHPGFGRALETRAFNTHLHKPETYQHWFSPTCIVVPPSGIVFQFPFPLARFNFYVTSDQFDNDRRPYAVAYDIDGELAQGDECATLIGPVPGDELPDGIDPRTRDHQMMVTAQLGRNPLTGEERPPMSHVEFYPDGMGVLLGLCQPVWTPGINLPQ